jgi:hypothetical protein
LAEPEKQNFWTTLPGVLTGIAAVLTAATGLLVLMYPHGFQNAKQIASPAAAGETAPVQAGGGSAPLPGPSSQQPKKATVMVTEKDGTATNVFLNSFRDSYSNEAIEFKNGQSIPFSKIRLIDFLDEHNYQQDVRVTLTDGRVVEGEIMSGEQMTGETDIGPFSISVKSLKQVAFPR